MSTQAPSPAVRPELIRLAATATDKTDAIYALLTESATSHAA